MATVMTASQTPPAPRSAPSAAADSSTNSPPATTSLSLQIGGMTCASCALRVEKGLKKEPGVAEAAMNLATERATVTLDPTHAAPADLVQTLVRRVEATGYTATPVVEPPRHAPAPSARSQERTSSTTDLAISGMTCASCVQRVEKALSTTLGVREANVNLATEH